MVHLPLAFTPPRLSAPLVLSRRQPATRGDFLPSDFWGWAPSAPASCGAQPSLLPSNLPFPTLRDPWTPSPRVYAPHQPGLESNFPHHIPQKLLRGGAGSNATHEASPRTVGTSEHFYLLFPLPPCPVSPALSFLSQSKTISEHIARVWLRFPSLFLSRAIPTLFSSPILFALSLSLSLPLSLFLFPSCRAGPSLCHPTYSTSVKDVITRCCHYCCHSHIFLRCHASQWQSCDGVVRFPFRARGKARASRKHPTENIRSGEMAYFS